MAARLRSVRRAFGLSQRALARRAGVTNGTVSLVEQGQVSPSIGSLKKLVSAMGLSLAEFFTMNPEEHAGPFFRAASLPQIGGGRVSLHMVPRGVPDAKLQVLHERYPEGADTGAERLSHAGEEAGVVVRGRISVQVGSHEAVLEPGDAYYFDSRIPHRFRNVGDEPCEIVSASTPRTF